MMRALITQRGPAGLIGPAPRVLIAGAFALTLLGTASHAAGNGDPPSAGLELPTHFERFVTLRCSPCVKESYPVAALSIGPLKLPAFPRPTGGTMTRGGEVALEVVRAYPVGRTSQQFLAVRVILSVATGAAEMYRLTSGLLDEHDVPVLATAVADMSRAVSTPATSTAESIDLDFHGGTVRVGVISVRGESVAYVQATDLPRLALRPVWEVPGIFLPASELAALERALGQIAAKMRQLRGQ